MRVERQREGLRDILGENHRLFRLVSERNERIEHRDVSLADLRETYQRQSQTPHRTPLANMRATWEQQDDLTLETAASVVVPRRK